jgi:ribosomal protein S17
VFFKFNILMLKKVFGVVEKIIDDSTIVIVENKIFIHSLYKKSMKIKKKFMVHKDRDMVVVIGDKVCALECPPISKRKKLVLVNV